MRVRVCVCGRTRINMSKKIIHAESWERETFHLFYTVVSPTRIMYILLYNVQEVHTKYFKRHCVFTAV